MKSTAVTQDLLIGQLVEGRFLVEALLGRGGMATVYKVKEQPSGRILAAKFLPPEHGGESEFRRRFEREARSMAKLDHPHVIRVHAVGVHQDQAYYVMDYLPHPDLDKTLAGGKTLPPAEALDIAIGIGRALEYVHERGLVHRDLKPSNVMVLPGGRPILMDFGLVRDEERTQLTATGAVMGTPLYMSPELMKGQAAGPASDLYQVGLLLYEMLAGVAAQKAGTMIEVAEKVLSGALVPLEEVAPKVPAPVAQLVANLLAFEPGERYPSARAFLADAVRARRGQSVAPLGEGLPSGGSRPPGPAGSGSGARPAAAPALGLARSDPAGGRSGAISLPGASASSPRLRSGAFAAPRAGGVAAESQPGLASGGFSQSQSGVGPASPGPPKAALAAGFALVLAGVVAYAAWPRDYRPTELRLEPSITGFTARWRTGSPAPSALEVRRPGGEWRVVRPEKDAALARREHEVRAGGFREGERLELRVLSPGGQVGPVEDLELPRFELKDLAAEAVRAEAGGRGPGDRIAIRFVAPVPVRAVLGQIGGDGRSRSYRAESPDRLSQRFVIERPAADLAGLELEAELLDSGGERVRVDLAARLASLLDEGADRVARWELAPVIRERLTPPEAAGKLLGKLGGPDDRAEREGDELKRRAALEASCIEWLETRPEFRWVRTAHALLPWILSAPAVPVAVRCRIYQGLDRFFALAWFARERGMRRLYEEVPADWGAMAESHEPGLGPAASYPIAVPPGLAFGTMSLEGRATLGEDFTVELPRDPPAGKRAELSLAVEKTFKDDIGLRVRINDAVTLSFYGIRSRLREGKAFVHRFPAELLKKGVNRIRVEIQVQETVVTTRQIHLVGLGLDVEE